jgi:hypothetical protein
MSAADLNTSSETRAVADGTAEAESTSWFRRHPRLLVAPTKELDAHAEPAPLTARAVPRAHSRVIVVLLALVGTLGFAGFLLWQARVGTPTVKPDTKDYVSVAAEPFASRAFLAGIRPPLTPLLWKVTGNVDTFVLTQTCIAIASWMFLAWIASRLVRGQWLRLGAGALVLGFASTRPIMLWNRSVLSESLALSSLALVFATVIWWVQDPSKGRAVALVVAAAMFAVARDSNIFVIALLAAVLAVGALARRATTPRVAWLAIVGLAAVATLTFAAAISSHRANGNVVNVLDARVFPYHDRVVWWADHGMPQAREIEAVARRASHRDGRAPVVSWRVWRDPAFHELKVWVEANGQRVYLEWLATHPGYVFMEPFRRPERSALNGNDLSGYVPTDRTDAPVLTSALYPPWPVVVVIAGAAVVVGIRLRRARRMLWRIVALMGALGLVHMLIAWHADGMESRRHALEGNAQARLAVVLLVIMLLPEAVARARDRQLRDQSRSKKETLSLKSAGSASGVVPTAR